MTQAQTSLSGQWQGQFSYPRVLSPEFFTAQLLDGPDGLGGSIQETRKGGRLAGQVLYATVSGARRGASVTFWKTYEGTGLRHKVLYEGAVNAEATEIEGRWRIPGNWSGRFLMIRDSGRVAAVYRQANEKLPV